MSYTVVLVDEYKKGQDARVFTTFETQQQAEDYVGNRKWTGKTTPYVVESSEAESFAQSRKTGIFAPTYQAPTIEEERVQREKVKEARATTAPVKVVSQKNDFVKTVSGKYIPRSEAGEPVLYQSSSRVNLGSWMSQAPDVAASRRQTEAVPTQFNDFNTTKPSSKEKPIFSDFTSDYSRPQNRQETMFMPLIDTPDFNKRGFEPSSLTISKDYGSWPRAYDDEINLGFGTFSFERAKEKMSFSSTFDTGAKGFAAFTTITLFEGVGRAKENLFEAGGFYALESVAPKVSPYVAAAYLPSVATGVQKDIAERGVYGGLLVNLPTFGLFAGASKTGRKTNVFLKDRAMNVRYRELVDPSFTYNPSRELFMPSAKEVYIDRFGIAKTTIDVQPLQRGFGVGGFPDVVGVKYAKEIQMQLKPGAEGYLGQKPTYRPVNPYGEGILDIKQTRLSEFKIDSPLNPLQTEVLRKQPLFFEQYEGTQGLLKQFEIKKLPSGGLEVNFFEKPKVAVKRPIKEERVLFVDPTGLYGVSQFAAEKGTAVYKDFSRTYSERLRPKMEILGENILDTAVKEKPFKLKPVVFSTGKPITTRREKIYRMPIIKFSAGTRQRQETIQQNKIFEDIKIFTPQKPKVDIIPKIKVDVGQRQDVIAFPITDTIGEPFKPRTPKPPREITPREPPTDKIFAFKPLDELGKKRKRGVSAGIFSPFKGRYTSSVGAVLFNIRGKQPKTITGSEVRPLPLLKRRRRR